MSWPPKLEPGRDRDPRKTPNVPSRSDIVGADNQIDTVIEDVHFEVSTAKACASQSTASRDSSFLCCVICRVVLSNIPVAPSLHRSHQELLLCTAAATVTMCVPTAFEKQERALNALNVEKRILAADSQLPSLCYLLSWRLAQGPVLSRSLVALRWSVPVQEHAMQPLASSDRCGVPRPSFPPRACTRDLIALFRVTGDLSIIVLKVSSTWNRD